MTRPGAASAGHERGQATVLIVGLTAVLLLLVAVVVDASAAFLAQRSLSAAADGAATAAAGALDESAVYGGITGSAVPLDPAGAQETVHAYAADARLAERFPGFTVVAVRTDGDTVTVTLGALAPRPLVRYLGGDRTGGHPIRVSASARSPFEG